LKFKENIPIGRNNPTKPKHYFPPISNKFNYKISYKPNKIIALKKLINKKFDKINKR
jgi:hypothetical protein